MPQPERELIEQKALLMRARRRELGLGQIAFAKKLGTSQRAVSRWETARVYPSARWRKMINRVLTHPVYDK